MLQIICWVVFAGLVIMQIIGVFLGHKYEKATGKISVGKIISIVSIIAVVILSSVLILFYVLRQRAEAYESGVRVDDDAYIYPPGLNNEAAPK